jgi:hypothetical protein
VWKRDRGARQEGSRPRLQRGLAVPRRLVCESLEERSLLSVTPALPTVVSTTPSIAGGALLARATSIQVRFSTDVTGGATSANYQLQSILPLSGTHKTSTSNGVLASGADWP